MREMARWGKDRTFYGYGDNKVDQGEVEELIAEARHILGVIQLVTGEAYIRGLAERQGKKLGEWLHEYTGEENPYQTRLDEERE